MNDLHFYSKFIDAVYIRNKFQFIVSAELAESNFKEIRKKFSDEMHREAVLKRCRSESALNCNTRNILTEGLKGPIMYVRDGTVKCAKLVESSVVVFTYHKLFGIFFFLCTTLWKKKLRN